MITNSLTSTVITTALLSCSLAVSSLTAGQATTAHKPVVKAAPAKPDATSDASKGVTSKSLTRFKATEADKANFDSEMRIAVIVAPKYGGSGLVPLRWTLSDATELSKELERQNYQVRVITNDEAYAENIREILRSKSKAIEGTNNATFLFAFTGHGFGLPDGHNYLVTSDLTIPGDTAPLTERVQKQALSVEEVEQLMAASGARRKVIFVDACRSDPNGKGGEEEVMKKFQAAEGFAILLSTKFGGTSYEDAALGHGLFTNFILEGLRGKAARDGYVTFYDLARYVEDSVLNYAMKIDRVQKPFRMGEQSGDFLLGTAAPPTPEQVAQLAPAVAAKIDNEAQVLVSPELHQSFITSRSGDLLTIYEASSLQPYSSGLKSVPAQQGYLRFEGPGPQNALVQIVLEMNGDRVKAAHGRIGQKCANDQACGTSPDALPGELQVAQQSSGTKVSKGCETIAGVTDKIGKIWGRTSGKIDKTRQTCGEATTAQTQLDPLKKYTWKPFSMVVPMPKAVAQKAAAM